MVTIVSLKKLQKLYKNVFMFLINCQQLFKYQSIINSSAHFEYKYSQTFEFFLSYYFGNFIHLMRAQISTFKDM